MRVVGVVLWFVASLRVTSDRSSAPRSCRQFRLCAPPPRASLSAFMRAHQSITNSLAEEFGKNKKTDPIPEQYKGFEEVFEKAKFDTLPPKRPWDHAIELKPGSEPAGCKVYPLNLDEQKELDAFLKEHLCTRHIQPSKSLMASPFFFVKKKNGRLRPLSKAQ